MPTVLTLARMCTRPHIHNYMPSKVPVVVMETPYPELEGRSCVPKKCHGNFFFFLKGRCPETFEAY